MNQNENNEEETLDFTKPTYEFKPKANHSFKQQGPYLVCKSCEVTHSVWVGIEKILVGFNEGKPILKKRKEVMGA